MKTAYGFGVRPQLRQNHFFVVKPGALGGSFVRVYERFRWTAPGSGPSSVRDAELGPDLNPVYRDGQRIEGADTLRLELPPAKWDKVSAALAAEFNPRLRKADLPTAKFLVGGTPVDPDFGKEMMVLLWAIKEADPSQISDAIENWRGLLPEERRWLYTTANVKWGGLSDRRGWRAGLRDAGLEKGSQVRPRRMQYVGRLAGGDAVVYPWNFPCQLWYNVPRINKEPLE